MLFLVAGCSEISTPPWQADGHGEKLPSEDIYRVVWADQTLRDHDVVRVARVVADRTRNDRLQVYCELLNRSQDDLTVQIQVAFKDHLGRAQETTPWQTVVLSALAGNGYSATSIRTDADDYLIRIRLASPALIFD